MRIFNQEYGLATFSRGDLGFRSLRLRTKLLLALIPPVVIILVITGYITHRFSEQFLTEALERNVQVQTLAIAHEVEIFLNQSREDLLIMAQGPVGPSDLLLALDSRRSVRGEMYRELAFLSNRPKETVFFVASESGTSAIPSTAVANVRPNPMALLERAAEMGRNEVWISEVQEVVYPGVPDGKGALRDPAKVIRMAAPYFGDSAKPKGLLMLAVDAHQIREILSLFNSPRSPLFAYVRSPEVRFSYLFDREGWILFQSEAEDQRKALSTEMARGDWVGTAGRPGLDGAFRPDARHKGYWRMVEDVLAGRHGLLAGLERGDGGRQGTSQAVGYAPVRFEAAPSGGMSVVGGVAFVDRSRLSLWAGYRQVDVIFVMTVATILIVSLLIFALSRAITRPTLRIAAAVNESQERGSLEEIVLPDQDFETSLLKSAVNKMIRTLRAQIQEIREKDERLEADRRREKVRLEEEIASLKRHLHGHEVEGIVGHGPVIDALKSELLKAASVDADVLIVGETGTGKQLIAEAIHRHSARADKPFIAINSGALDENLLLDSLFGHVKGAFTEAKAERKGAFLAAHGGTLFLDEIGTASPRVQQALLRAVAMRKVSPLGSDQELDVDVRLIAATNVDLKGLIEKGLFREDLYYRLEVLTIRTPALRDHRESIPILVDYFLKQACRLVNKEGIGLSRGALEKLKSHPWPGNVRELMNCVTRAVVMAGGNLIQAGDLKLGGEEPRPGGKGPEPAPEAQAPLPLFAPGGERSTLPEGLSARQRKAYPHLLQNGWVSRSEYQRIVGNDLPSRTAIYDLQDLVKKGIVRKEGKGPATQYYLVGWRESAT